MGEIQSFGRAPSPTPAKQMDYYFFFLEILVYPSSSLTCSFGSLHYSFQHPCKWSSTPHLFTHIHTPTETSIHFNFFTLLCKAPLSPFSLHHQILISLSLVGLFTFTLIFLSPSLFIYCECPIPPPLSQKIGASNS